MIYLFELILRAYIAGLKWAVQSLARILLGIRDSFLWACRSVREKPSRIIGILSVFVPVGVLAGLGRREWFLNWPVMFVAALALYGALKSPLSAAPSFLRKLVKLGIATCIVLGWSMLLGWQPLLSAFGLTRHDTFWPWLIGSVCFWAAAAWIVFPEAIVSLAGHRSQAVVPRQGGSRRLRFTDVGGMEEAKQQIRELVESRLNPAKY